MGDVRIDKLLYIHIGKKTVVISSEIQLVSFTQKLKFINPRIGQAIKFVQDVFCLS